MKTFSDNAGRTWTVTVNVDAVKRVKSLLGVNLLEAVDGKLLEQLIGDPVLLCDVIFGICKPQADAQKVSDEDFGRSMAGDSIELATTALLEELCDFFPLARRNLLRKALTKLKKLESMALTVAENRLDSPELEKIFREALSGEAQTAANAIGKSSGNLPDSSASIPAP